MKINIEPSKKALRKDRIKKDNNAIILASDDKESFDALIDNCKTIEDIKQILKSMSLLLSDIK